MKYLDKTFTIYPLPQLSISIGPARTPDKKHHYVDIGGMCWHCSLDKKGHQQKMKTLGETV